MVALIGSLQACAPSSDIDGGVVDASYDAAWDMCNRFPCIWPMPDASAPDASAPLVMCGDDAGVWSTDPCPRWVDCAFDGTYYWTAEYSGSCGAGGTCQFTGPPIWTWCHADCYMPGPYGHCHNTGPTAP